MFQKLFLANLWPKMYLLKTVVVPSILNPLENDSGTKYTRPAWRYVAPGTTDVHLLVSGLCLRGYAYKTINIITKQQLVP